MVEEDEFVAGALSLDFVNTVGGHRAGRFEDKLETYADLVQWSVMSGSFSKARAELLLTEANNHPEAAVRMLRRSKNFREALHAVFDAAIKGRATPKASLETVNQEVGAALAHALIRRDGDRYAWGWSEAETLDTPLWPIARDAGELLTSDRLARLMECNSETCGWFFLDTSKNHTRRWCSMRGCGNRAKVRRYRGEAK
jgi:predicted RNA-binding Zn ribbon-like protein